MSEINVSASRALQTQSQGAVSAENRIVDRVASGIGDRGRIVIHVEGRSAPVTLTGAELRALGTPQAASFWSRKVGDSGLSQNDFIRLLDDIPADQLQNGGDHVLGGADAANLMTGQYSDGDRFTLRVGARGTTAPPGPAPAAAAGRAGVQTRPHASHGTSTPTRRGPSHRATVQRHMALLAPNLEVTSNETAIMYGFSDAISRRGNSEQLMRSLGHMTPAQIRTELTRAVAGRYPNASDAERATYVERGVAVLDELTDRMVMERLGNQAVSTMRGTAASLRDLSRDEAGMRELTGYLGALQDRIAQSQRDYETFQRAYGPTTDPQMRQTLGREMMAAVDRRNALVRHLEFMTMTLGLEGLSRDRPDLRATSSNDDVRLLARAGTNGLDLSSSANLRSAIRERATLIDEEAASLHHDLGAPNADGQMTRPPDWGDVRDEFRRFPQLQQAVLADVGAGQDSYLAERSAAIHQESQEDAQSRARWRLGLAIGATVAVAAIPGVNAAVPVMVAGLASTPGIYAAYRETEEARVSLSIGEAGVDAPATADANLRLAFVEAGVAMVSAGVGGRVVSGGSRYLAATRGSGAAATFVRGFGHFLHTGPGHVSGDAILHYLAAQGVTLGHAHGHGSGNRLDAASAARSVPYLSAMESALDDAHITHVEERFVVMALFAQEVGPERMRSMSAAELRTGLAEFVPQYRAHAGQASAAHH